MARTSRRLARRTSRKPRRRTASARRRTSRRPNRRRTSRVRRNISARSLPAAPPTGEHTIGDWDWWFRQAFPVGVPVKTTRPSTMHVEYGRHFHEYDDVVVPVGTRAEVVGEPQWSGAIWRVPVRIVDARDEQGYQLDALIGQTGSIIVELVDGEFVGLEPLEDRWPRGGRRTSRHQLPRVQRSRMKPNPAPPYPRRPPGVGYFDQPPSYTRKISDWMDKTFPPGTPVATTIELKYSGTPEIPAGARGEVIGRVAPGKTLDDDPERVWVRIVDARDASGIQISSVVGATVGMSADIMRPLVDHWAHAPRRTSRHALPRSQRSWMKPNQVPLPPRDRYAPRQTPEYLEWVARTFSPGTPVRFLKPYITYSEGGKLLDISPGSEGSVVDSAHYPETVHIWLDGSDTHPYPCIAAIDTEFEAVEEILSPMRDNWEVSGDAPTERHQSFLRMKDNPATESQGYDARKGAPLMDARVGTTVTDGKLSRTTAGLRVGVITDVDRPAPGDVRVRWSGETAGVHKRRSLYRVEYDMAANPSYRWETLSDVEGSNPNDSYGTLHAGMQSWNPNEWETTGLAFDDDGVELGEEAVALIRQQHQFRAHGPRRNPDRKRLDIEVGDTVELERHPVYDHPGQVPAYKVTKRKVKSVEWLEGGGALLKFVGARQRSGGGGYIDKLYRLGGSEERGWWLNSSSPPSRYLVLQVIKKVQKNAAKTQKKPRAEGCKVAPSKMHTKGPLWSCEGCEREACSRCAKYYWKRTARSGTMRMTKGGFVFEGERVALCPRCWR